MTDESHLRLTVMVFLEALSCLDKKAYLMEVHLTKMIATCSFVEGRGDLTGLPVPWNVLGKQAFNYDVVDST